MAAAPVILLRTIRGRLISSSLLAITLPLVLFSILGANILWRFYLDELRDELKTKAEVIAEAVQPSLAGAAADPLEPKRAVERWRRYSNIRVTIVDRQGFIRAATVAEDVGARFDDQVRPGLAAALAGRANSTLWKNPRFDYQDTMYANVPVRAGERTVGAVRVAYTLTQIQQRVGHIRGLLLTGIGAYGLLVLGLTLWLASDMARPLEGLTRSARRLAAGELEHRAAVKGLREVTELGGTLNQMAERLQHLEGLRRRYVSDVSHELRTPLAAIRGMAETLIEHGKSDPALSGRYLPRILSQTDRLARLATQLLDLANIESGNLLQSFAPVALETVLEEVVETCAVRAAAAGVALELEVPPDLPEISGDRDRLVQVFLNLVDNALRHTPSGGRVAVTARAQGEHLRAEVADTGEGIPPESLPHLFERFYRVDTARTRKSGGTGLGLAIVRQIVKAHGGTIEVESQVGAGTRFLVSLPLP